MKFLSLALENFGPYKGSQQITFPTEEQRRVMVIYGDNMRGKTSLLNAIRWVLYGTAVDRLSRELDLLKLINSEAQRDQDYRMSVRLRFEANGSEYELARSVEPLDLITQPRSNAHFKRDVLLRRNGVAIRGDEIENSINSFIPRQVARFYLFDGELLQEYESLLIEESAQGQSIKEAIEQVLGVPALINGRDEAKELLKKAQSIQVKELKHVDALASSANQSQMLQSQIGSHEDDQEAQRRRLDECVTKLDLIERELATTAASQNVQQRLSSTVQQLQEARSEWKTLQEERLTCMRGAWRDLLQSRLDLRRRELTENIESSNSVVKKRGAIEDRIARLERVLKISICPTCEAPVSEDRRIRLAEELGTFRADLLGLQVDTATAGELSREFSALSKLTGTNALPTLKRLEGRLQKNSVLTTKLENTQAELEEQLRGHDVARVAQLQKEKDGLLKLRGKVEGAIEAIAKDIADKKRLVDQIAVNMSKNPEARRLRSSVEVGLYTALESLFAKGIDTLRDRLREKVAYEASSLFRALTTESSYEALQINRNYGLTIVNKLGETVPVRSAGAEQIVAMSLLGALNRVVNRPGPLVIDTPFGRLDPKHRKNILTLIPKMAQQIVFLVHEGEISKDSGLDPIAESIAGVWEIERVSATHSVFVKA